MDYDLSRWLKNDLGLLHMSEADIRCFMFHPRHGGLCRRLIKFLAESTLCNQRFPNVYAREEHTVVSRELDDKNILLDKTLDNLEHHYKANENGINELSFLKAKLDYLSRIDELQRTSADAFEAMVSRPNFGLEQIRHNIEDPVYLGNLDLEDIYSQHELPLVDSNLSARQITTTEEEFDSLLVNSRVALSASSELVHKITKKMEDMELKDRKIRRRNVEGLLALKMPECEESVIEADLEKKELLEKRGMLNKSLLELSQQVIKLDEQFRGNRSETNARYKKELERDLLFLKRINEIESVFNDKRNV